MRSSFRDKLKLAAHSLTHAAIRAGKLPDLRKEEIDCVDCGARATDYDHRDLSRPIDVVPVCRKCNLKRGPALPPITAEDELTYKHSLGHHSGLSWNGVVGGEGWTPLECVCHIDVAPLEAVTDSVETLSRMEQVNSKRERSHNRDGIARVAYFKSHDPWRLN